VTAPGTCEPEYSIRRVDKLPPHGGRSRLRVIVKWQGEVVFNKSGPAAIVIAAFSAWIHSKPVYLNLLRSGTPPSVSTPESLGPHRVDL